MEAALWPQVRRPGERGAISHASVLAIFGLSDASSTKVHLTLRANARIRREVPRRLVVHYAELPPEDVREVEGVPVTTPERTIRDVHADYIGPALVRQAIDDGQRTGHLALDQAERLAREEA